MLVSDGKRSPHIDINIFDCWTQHDNIPGLSIRAITHNICYGWVCLIFLWCHGWNCLLLKEFIYKVTSLLWVWRTRLQVTQNLMTALHSKHCNRNLLTVWYLTCSLWSLMKYLVEHEKRNSISTSSMYYSVYHINILMTPFLMIFWRFSKSCPKVWKSFPNIFRRFLRKNRWCFDHAGTHLGTFQGIMWSHQAMVILLLLKITCYFQVWNNMLSSQVKISCLCYGLNLLPVQIF